MADNKIDNTKYRYSHLGIPTIEKRENETYLEAYDIDPVPLLRTFKNELKTFFQTH